MKLWVVNSALNILSRPQMETREIPTEIDSNRGVVALVRASLKGELPLDANSECSWSAMEI